jgi:hypothetical protein
MTKRGSFHKLESHHISVSYSKTTDSQEINKLIQYATVMQSFSVIRVVIDGCLVVASNVRVFLTLLTQLSAHCELGFALFAPRAMCVFISSL